MAPRVRPERPCGVAVVVLVGTGFVMFMVLVEKMVPWRPMREPGLGFCWQPATRAMK